MKYTYMGGITNDNDLIIGKTYNIIYNVWNRPCIAFNNGLAILNEWTLSKCFVPCERGEEK